MLEGTFTSLMACLQRKISGWVHRGPALQHHTTNPAAVLHLPFSVLPKAFSYPQADRGDAMYFCPMTPI